MRAHASKIRMVAVGIAVPLLLSACVSQGAYNDLKTQNEQLQSQNQQLQQQLTDAQTKIGQLRGAIKYTVESDTLFASGSWKISPQGKSILAKIAYKLAPTQTQTLVITGYTDNTPIGTGLQRQGITTNQQLSEKRAEAVKDFLVSNGGNPNLITTQGGGETNPVAPNDTASGRALNRRVEFSLQPD